MVQHAAAMLLRRLRWPQEGLALALEVVADGRRLLLSLLSPQLPDGDTGWDWWSISVKRLECMVLRSMCWLLL